MQEKLDIIINTINSNPHWDKNTKIRYAYIELGKIVHKNVDFFYTLYNKLGNRNLTSIQLNEILNNKIGYSVICKTTSEMLKYIFDNTGISSKIISTVKSDEYKDEYGTAIIKHYFLAVEGDNNKHYFLTLSADLANIQTGMKTEHFATNINYIVNDNIQIYEGERIDHSVMTEEEIQKLDQQIGYSLDKYEQLYTDKLFEIISDTYSTNKYYLNILSKHTNFYYDLVGIINGTNSDETECINVELFSVSDEDWNKVKKFICYTSMNKIFFDNNIQISDNEYSELEELLTNNNYDLFNNLLKEKIKMYGSKKTYEIFNPMAVLGKVYEFMSDIDHIKNISRDNPSEIKRFKEKFEYDLNKICSYFIERRYLPPRNKKFTSEYIAHKIMISFSNIFDFGSTTEFNSMKIGEQSAIIGKVIEILLKDLEANKKDPNYDLTKSPVKNRIITSVIIDKETNEYSYLIYISNDSFVNTNTQDNGIVLIYDLQNNYIRHDEGLGDIFLKYHVITDRLSINIEDIEKPSKTHPKK